MAYSDRFAVRYAGSGHTELKRETDSKALNHRRSAPSTPPMCVFNPRHT